jgi:hypothetical protein
VPVIDRMDKVADFGTDVKQIFKVFSATIFEVKAEAGEIEGEDPIKAVIIP